MSDEINGFVQDNGINVQVTYELCGIFLCLQILYSK